MIRRKQLRLQDYDYSSENAYFVTVCSKDRQKIFGEYLNRYDVGEGLASSHPNIQLSILGAIIDAAWNDILNHYPHIVLDEYVVMPNHVHGILLIDKRADARPAPTISDIICSFKSQCTFEYVQYIKKNNIHMSGKIWQRSFYDRIVRNDRELNHIREYIINNPLNWDTDEYNSENPKN